MFPTRWKAVCAAAIALSLLIGFGPALPRVDAKIVFCSKRNGDTDFHIYLMDDDGGNVERLTDPAFYDTRPRWFPDGRRVLFQRDHSRGSGIGSEQNSEFLILDLKTGKAETFMENHPTDSDPSVSPDGKYIAFNSERGGAADIYVLNLETGDLKQLTDIGDRSGWAYRTDWSPDGHQIAYELDVAPEGENIWLMNANGNRKRRFTPLPKGPNILFRGAPYWSPSGKYIMYYEVERSPDLQQNLSMSLIFQNLQTKLRRVHTFPKVSLVSPGCWMGSDETVLLWMKADYTDPFSNYEIYRYEVRSRQLTNLTNQPGSDYQPHWHAGPLSVSPVEKLTTLWGELKQTE